MIVIEKKRENGVIELRAAASGVAWGGTLSPGCDLSAAVAGPDETLTAAQQVEVAAFWAEEVAPGLTRAERFHSSLEPEAAPPSRADVVAERERRLSLGFDYDFGDARGIHRITTAPADMTGWDEVTKLASALLATGAGATEIQIVSDTGPVAVTAVEWQAILLAAAGFRQPIWAASFALQAMDPVPADYADDMHWPGPPA